MNKWMSQSSVIALVRDIAIAEISLAGLYFSVNYFGILELAHARASLDNIVSYDIFSNLVLLFLELFALLLVYLNWRRRFESQSVIGKIEEIISLGESDLVEFKETLRWDTRLSQVNKDLEKAVLKNIAGFLNASGGILIIGVSDQKTIKGLHDDYKSLPKPSSDGFENHLSQLIKTAFGMNNRHNVNINFAPVSGREICLIKVVASKKPVYYRDGEEESFFVRAGNNTSALTISEANEYISDHWPSNGK